MSNDTIIVPAVTAKWAKGTGGPAGDEVQNLVLDSGDVAATLRESDGHHGRSSPRGDGCDNLIAHVEGVASTLKAADGNKRGYSSPRGRKDDNLVAYQGQGSNVGPMGTLRSGNGNATGGVPFVSVPPDEGEKPDLAFSLPATAGRNKDGSRIGNAWNTTFCVEDPGRKMSGGAEVGLGVQEEIAYTLQAGARHAVAQPCEAPVPQEPMAVGENVRNELRLMPHTTALAAGGGKPGQGYQAVLLPPEPAAPDPGMEARMLVQGEPTAFSSKDNGRDATVGLSPTLRRGSHKDSHANAGVPPAIAAPNADGAARVGLVRRLTPTECERLQGFPDGWTCLCGCQPYSTAACKCSDGPRYRALGNAVCVNVVYWIARRMALIPVAGTVS